MKKTMMLAAAIGVALGACALPAAAQNATQAAAPPMPVAKVTTDDGAPWPEAWFEVFKLAPGKQEEFIRRIARADEIAKAGGQPPIQIFVHEEGADWDVLMFKPVRAVKPTPEQQAAMAAKRKELGGESGPAYFVAIRELIAEHTDTHTYGPLTAGQWLSRLDKWRADNPTSDSAKKAAKK